MPRKVTALAARTPSRLHSSDQNGISFMPRADGRTFMSTKLEQALKQQMANGLKINYYEDGAGPNLVLLHGMFGDYLDWAPVLEELAEKFHVVAPDLPGFGLSDKPDVPYSAEFFVDHLHAFFVSIQLTDITLVGNSFGGQIAILYALRHPETVKQLILVSSGGFREVPETERAVARTILSEANLRSMPATMVPFLFAKVFVRESAEKNSYLAKQTARLQAADYPEYVRALVRSIELSMATNLLEELCKLQCPVLILAGGKDAVVPCEQAREAAGRLPNAELQIMENSGHMPQLEDSEDFVRRVVERAFKNL